MRVLGRVWRQRTARIGCPLRPPDGAIAFDPTGRHAPSAGASETALFADADLRGASGCLGLGRWSCTAGSAGNAPAGQNRHRSGTETRRFGSPRSATGPFRRHPFIRSGSLTCGAAAGVTVCGVLRGDAPAQLPSQRRRPARRSGGHAERLGRRRAVPGPLRGSRTRRVRMSSSGRPPAGTAGRTASSATGRPVRAHGRRDRTRTHGRRRFGPCGSRSRSATASPAGAAARFRIGGPPRSSDHVSAERSARTAAGPCPDCIRGSRMGSAGAQQPPLGQLCESAGERTRIARRIAARPGSADRHHRRSEASRSHGLFSSDRGSTPRSARCMAADAAERDLIRRPRRARRRHREIGHAPGTAPACLERIVTLAAIDAAAGRSAFPLAEAASCAGCAPIDGTAATARRRCDTA